MRLWRKKKLPAFYGPYPEPGLYYCKSPKCGFHFINFGHDWWQGPVYPEDSFRRGNLYFGTGMIWEDLEEAYADCAHQLVLLT